MDYANVPSVGHNTPAPPQLLWDNVTRRRPNELFVPNTVETFGYVTQSNDISASPHSVVTISDDPSAHVPVISHLHNLTYPPCGTAFTRNVQSFPPISMASRVSHSVMPTHTNVTFSVPVTSSSDLRDLSNSLSTDIPLINS